MERAAERSTPRGFAPLAHHRIQNFDLRNRGDHTGKPFAGLSEVVSLAMGVQRLRAVILLHDLVDLWVRRAAMQRIKDIPGLVRAHQFGQVKEGFLIGFDIGILSTAGPEISGNTGPNADDPGVIAAIEDSALFGPLLPNGQLTIGWGW